MRKGLEGEGGWMHLAQERLHIGSSRETLGYQGVCFGGHERRQGWRDWLVPKLGFPGRMVDGGKWILH